MNIGILGGGAIGLLVASYVQNIHNVVVYTRTQNQADILNEKGIQLICDDKMNKKIVHAEKISNNISEIDILFVAVKQYHMNDISEIVRNVNVNNIIFLQNGMGHLDHLENYLTANIGIGIVEHGAIKLDYHVVEHTGIGKIRIGNVHGKMNIAGIFCHDNFVIEVEEDWEKVVLKKLMVNAIINPLTAIFRVVNGDLIKNKYYFQMMNILFEEVYSVIGFEDKSEIFSHIELICKKTAKNKSSMLRDIENGNQTEIDNILGYILKKAKENEINIPLVTFLYYSIKGIEESFAFANKLDYNL